MQLTSLCMYVRHAFAESSDPVDIVSESSHVCDDAPPTPDTPTPGVTPCTASATETSLANHTFLHGDM